MNNRRFFPPLVIAGLWMLGALISFMLMAIAGRELSTELSTFQILFFRSVVGIAVVSVVLTWKGWAQVKTRQIGTHLIRNAVHFLGQYGWFYGIALIPLAEVFAIEFTVPVWTAIIAALVLGERITRGRAIAIALGVAGVLVILRPGIAVLSVGALAVLGGAISYGLSHTLTKKLSGTDTPLAIVFYMTVIQMPLGLIPAIYDWAVLSYEMPSGGMWWWLLVVGVFALTAHYCIAKAFMLADATVVVPMDFLRLPLIAVVGFVLYGEPIQWFVLAGALLMLVGNLINIYLERPTYADSVKTPSR